MKTKKKKKHPFHDSPEEKSKEIVNFHFVTVERIHIFMCSIHHSDEKQCKKAVFKSYIYEHVRVNKSKTKRRKKKSDEHENWWIFIHEKEQKQVIERNEKCKWK